MNIIHDFQGRMAENEDTLEAGRPICKLLQKHKLSKDVRNIDLRNIQEVEVKSLGDDQYKTDWERGKKLLKFPAQAIRGYSLI